MINLPCGLHSDKAAEWIGFIKIEINPGCCVLVDNKLTFS
jgi:hypothetical protein